MILEGNYLNAETAKNGEIITFVDDGVESIIQQNGKDKNVINFNVTRGSDNKQFIYTPSWTSIKTFKQAWGNDTKKWVGKQFKAEHLTIMNYGKKQSVIEPVPFTNEEKVN